MQNYKTSIEENHSEILKHLHIGTKIPILPDFQKYLPMTLEDFNARAIIIYDDANDNVIGITLIFDDNNILYFGWCGVHDDSEDLIQLIVDKLIEYAKENKFEVIRGPTNIPPIFFGYGFMTGDSSTDLSLGRPIDPPVYQDTFLKNNFKVMNSQDTYRFEFKKIDLSKYKSEFKDYEYISFSGDKIDTYLPEWVRIAKTLPRYVEITPNTAAKTKVIIDYIFRTIPQEHDMGCVLKERKSGKIVAFGYLVPNRFQEDRLNYELTMVDIDYQGKGLIKWLLFNSSNLFIDKFKYCIGYYAKENIKIIGFLKKYLSAILERRHNFLEYKIK